MKFKKIGLIIIIILVAISIPIIIKIKWGNISNGEFVLYLGSIISGFGTFLGVKYTIDYEKENKIEERNNSVKPFLAMTTRHRNNDFISDAKNNGNITEREEELIYPEGILSEVAITISDQGVLFGDKLTEEQKEIILHRGNILEERPGGSFVWSFTYSYCSWQIKNVGCGPAILFRIGLNKSGTKLEDKKFLPLRPLSVNEKFILHIFIDGLSENILGKYSIDLCYNDIYDNTYFQRHSYEITSKEGAPSVAFGAYSTQEKGAPI